jgi:hypothetical protein
VLSSFGSIWPKYVLTSINAEPQRYKDNAWVAGYNPLNEPTDQEHSRLLDFYDRIDSEIRAIDPDHILFLEYVRGCWSLFDELTISGNNFGADFSRFGERPLIKNAVYACHDYSSLVLYKAATHSRIYR